MKYTQTVSAENLLDKETYSMPIYAAAECLMDQTSLNVQTVSTNFRFWRVSKVGRDTTKTYKMIVIHSEVAYASCQSDRVSREALWV